VPTFSFTLPGLSSAEVAARLAQDNINVWDGNFYAIQITERLGIEEQGGLVRVGAVHYNTREEISRLGDSLRKITAS
jgi:selenocysteine lyase/cysteine desulfurase